MLKMCNNSIGGQETGFVGVEFKRVHIAGEKCSPEACLGGWMNILVGIVSDIKNVGWRNAVGSKFLFEKQVKVLPRFCEAILIGKEAEEFSEP